MTQTSNQFQTSPEKGALTLDQNWSTLNAQVAAGTADLTVGQAVLIKDVGGPQIPVEEIAAVTDKIFGFVTYNVRTETYAAQDSVKIAKNGDVMIMEASAAIARGALLEVIISGNRVVTKTSGTTIGQALDKAAADGDFIRVLITV